MNDDELETLDPENWDEMRRLAHAMVDDAMDFLESAGDGPVWQQVPGEIARTFDEAVPAQPTRPEEVYRQFRENIFPYPMGNIHPRFWAWYMGNGTVMGALADFLAATMNSNMGGGTHAAAMVEFQVLDWMKQVIGMPDSASGLLVSGGSMANLVGITVARNALPGLDIRRDGLQGLTNKLTVYASVEVHMTVQKAVEILGMGSDSLRKVPVRADFTMDIQSLAQVIRADIKQGCKPVCVVATSGTVNTGAIDDLVAVADLCEENGIWFHVDGCIGALGMMSDEVRPLLAGIERADSVALDPHKWMHVPFEAGCVLVRDARAHYDAFALNPEYLQHAPRGNAAGSVWFFEYGLQLSRAFRALKVWMTLKEHGTEKLGRIISRNVEQAAYLATLVEHSDRIELTAPVGLDIVCYRYNPGGLDMKQLNEINREILLRMQEEGVVLPSDTTLDGVYCIRVAIANHRSRNEDFDLLVAETLRIGAELAP
jgi:glutamate/tyrosine decarboxylase-like PLP-dependent enzyme